ncbi:hypothetical protein [Paenibacillus xylaniclasticus]|uniref:hypothetical protein n=1 Tax=Paenibacillus xylaniclasticus TaxID=588083 RepID=UPI0013DEE084|nr:MULTISPECIES: hypothetical protein [Paenibacillus]GFN30990.1 hypothetical protein PCURB6_12500 [Paenibacillus curdlanolyticus]
MITEAAFLYVKDGLSEPLEADFRKASASISGMKGYLVSGRRALREGRFESSGSRIH